MHFTYDLMKNIIYASTNVAKWAVQVYFETLLNILQHSGCRYIMANYFHFLSSLLLSIIVSHVAKYCWISHLHFHKLMEISTWKHSFLYKSISVVIKVMSQLMFRCMKDVKGLLFWMWHAKRFLLCPKSYHFHKMTSYVYFVAAFRSYSESCATYDAFDETWVC